MKYLISACLIGTNCKYDGKNNLENTAKLLYDKGLAFPVCPEELGGLPTPRIPAEIIDDNVISKEGTNVTKEYKLGASKSLQYALDHNIRIAILQARSPSCGSSKIYDGTFTGTLIHGEGKTTELLRKNGIKVITIEEYIRDYYEEDFT